MTDVAKIGSMILIPTELLEDTVDVYAYVRRDLTREFTATHFGEDWSGPREERERLEHGRTIPWDPRYWPDEFEEDD